ncbi:bifunctional ADP-dependent NAD(P)H-hydrate dehydratase/NAD(P)H-hydrate epimerase [Longibacter salinarum]|uniref:Bifunctional NAD(P)H-hydrate repair enzyme n=1 Tax=Longibacter salinarum TaxID=1850348 RepID=A0A2A8CWR3_9BACT|nr:NAD(P)H-hydrate dehydratase [Longibacter salinarum]PEN13086.1 bifunctional ADP-dependent NAD(P)H-hydrate dehydratase/NAD(P)H-hydrate epimerase [Longibacter salinarum]
MPDRCLPRDVLLTADAMRKADRTTIEDFGLPGFTLMETAGRGATSAILRRYGPAETIRAFIICGKGNNGGDGLVVARHLAERGARVHVACTAPPEDLRDDPAHNLELLQSLANSPGSAADNLTLSTCDRVEALEAQAAAVQPSLYVDAMLGTGLTSEVREPLRGMVEWLNGQEEKVTALDIPTGLHSDTGAALGVCVRADQTATMASMKAGLVVGDGAQYAGEIDIVDIGMPRYILSRVSRDAGCAFRTSDEDLCRWWPERANDAHKYSVGMTVVVGGAPGYIGAPVMASRAAARAGSGYVACACPESIESTLAQKMTSIPTLALPEWEDGLAPDIHDTLSDRLDKARALLVGPGLGRKSMTQSSICDFLSETDLPAVIDADGLNAIAGVLGAEDGNLEPNGRWILTPHAGEFKRLAGEDVDFSDRIGVAQAYAKRWNVVLLLKGHPSVVASPDGTTFVGGAGGPSLAVAGTGDVLAGLCAGFLAQGLQPIHAAAAGMHLGGAAADRYATHSDARTMQATDVLDEVAKAAYEICGTSKASR